MELFDSDGSIQPGLHQYSYQEFIQQFVQDFPHSQTREEIYTLSFLWLAEVKRQMTPTEVWFNGSFISSAMNPKYVEMCVFIAPEETKELRVEECLRLQGDSDRYKCRAYFGLLSHSVNAWDSVLGPYYWTEQFGFDLYYNPKGIIVLSWKEILSALD